MNSPQGNIALRVENAIATITTSMCSFTTKINNNQNRPQDHLLYEIVQKKITLNGRNTTKKYIYIYIKLNRE